MLFGGSVRMLPSEVSSEWAHKYLEPKETRMLFQLRGWETVVAFQTRNPIHRAHEYLMKVALEFVDGLMIHPLVGSTKGDDIPADVRMDCYQVMLDKYLPGDRAVLSVFPAVMPDPGRLFSMQLFGKIMVVLILSLVGTTLGWGTIMGLMMHMISSRNLVWKQ